MPNKTTITEENLRMLHNIQKYLDKSKTKSQDENKVKEGIENIILRKKDIGETVLSLSSSFMNLAKYFSETKEFEAAKSILALLKRFINEES